jgi:hypothetical protein
MTVIYALYSCMHFNKTMPAPQADTTQCMEAKVFFQSEQCRKEVPANDQVVDQNMYVRTWSECRERQSQSWIPQDDPDGVPRLYKAEARVSDQEAMTGLLSPLQPKVRSMIPTDGRLRGTFQGPGKMSFFVVGDGDRVIVFAVSNLNDSQFINIAAAVSNLKGAADNLDFEVAAEHAGVKLHYHSETVGPGAQALLASQNRDVYKDVSVTEFAAIGSELAAKSTRVHLSGYYALNGRVPVLFADAQAGIGSMNSGARAPNVPLLLDHASSEITSKLSFCATHPYTVACNKVDISGVATMCAVSEETGRKRSVPCVDVEHN